MKKLKRYLIIWQSGEKIKGISVSLYDITELYRIYSMIILGDKPEFINGNVKDILDKCGIKTVQKGIGWKIA